jgi:nucleotidyltransferase substrate binding protein (TIGR01987 family)
MATTVEELKKAISSLKTANELLKSSMSNDPKNIDLHKALRDACIQRFEFCIELSWKTAMRILGLDVNAPNPAIRDMAQNHLIDDPKIWFDFLQARYKTSHTYDEDVAKEVYLVVEKSAPHLDELAQRLQKVK